jgi:hypothetical protein
MNHSWSQDYCRPRGQSDLVNVSVSYVLDGIQASSAKQIADQIKAYWQKQGYTFTVTTQGIGTDAPNILATTKDGYNVALQTGKGGPMSLGASSPCAEPAK